MRKEKAQRRLTRREFLKVRPQERGRSPWLVLRERNPRPMRSTSLPGGIWKAMW